MATVGGTNRAVARPGARPGARPAEGAAPAPLPPFVGDRTGAAALYRQIAEHIEQALAADNSLVGTRLPAEESLAAAFAVTRVTLRRAIQELVRRGVVVPVHTISQHEELCLDREVLDRFQELAEVADVDPIGSVGPRVPNDDLIAASSH